MKTHSWLVRLVLAALIGLGGFLTGAPPQAAEASETVRAGWYVELWGETKWVEAEGILVVQIKVKRFQPPLQTVSLTLTRDTSTTLRFGTGTPPPDAGGGTDSFAQWEISLDNGGIWEATIEEHVRPATEFPPGSRVSNSVYLTLPGMDYLFHHTPVTTAPINTTTAANPGVQTISDPINTATGEDIVVPVVDLNLGGPLPLFFSRYYAAGLKDEGWAQSTLGDNWLHNFDVYLPVHSDDEVTVAYRGGKSIEFVRSYGGNTGWSLNFHQEPVRYWLARGRADNTGNFWLLDPEQELVYRFDDATGLLQEVRDRNGNRLTLTRDAQGKLTQVADGLGRSLAFSYDVGGNHLTRVSDGTRQVNFTHDASGYLVTAEDATGQTTTYSYAADLAHGPLLTRLTLPAGNEPTTQGYNASGQAVSQADAYGNTTTMAYGSPAADQTEVTRPDGSTFVFTHKDLRMTYAVRDAAGKSYTLDFNDREQPVAHHNRVGDTSSVTYDEATGSHKIASYTDAQGNTTTFSYEMRAQVFTNPDDPLDFVFLPFFDLKQVTYADGSHEDFTCDARGNVLTYADPLGKVWTFTYNTRGQVLTAANPQGGVTTYTYNDADGTLASSTDSDAGIGVTVYAYDGYKRLSTIARPGGATVQFTYDANDRLLTVTDERGETTTFTYNANGGMETAANSLLQTTSYYYDLMNRLHRVVDPAGRTYNFRYDTMKRVDAVTDRNGNLTSFGYNLNGWLTGVTDPDANTWTAAYDDEGRQTSATTPLGFTTWFQTDKLGRITRITDPLGNHADFGYSVVGQLTTVADPMGRVTNYAYDANRLLAGVTRPVVGAVIYTRNHQGLLTRVTDPRGKNWDFGYSTMGRMTSQTDPLGNLTAYAYDARGRLASITVPGGGTVAYTYDAASNVTQVAYPGGLILFFWYDGAGRLVRAADTASPLLVLAYDERGDITDSQDGSASFGATYDDGQRLATVSYGGQATVSYSYDGRNLLTAVEDDLSGAAMTFTYDDDGRLTGISRSNGVDTTYTYDTAGRVTRIQDGALADQQYTLNAAGEPTQVARTLPLDSPPAVGQVVSLSYDDASQISSADYVYDDLGRQTAAPGKTFVYDGASRLTSVTAGGNTASFTYNALGDLRTRTAGGVTTTYYHNYALGSNAIVAEKEGASYTRFYVYAPGGSLLYAIDPVTDEASFYHFDGAGSTLFLTDETGSLSDAYAYDPYGVLLDQIEASDQLFTYLGQYGVRWEPVGDVYEMDGWIYDPATGRFLTRDPGLSLADPETLNRYQYASQNPLHFVVPEGMCLCSEITTGNDPPKASPPCQRPAPTSSPEVNDANDLAQIRADIKRKEEEIRELTASKARSSFGYNVRTPDTTIKKPSNRIGGEDPYLSDKNRKILEAAQGGSPSLLQLYSHEQRIARKQRELANLHYAERTHGTVVVGAEPLGWVSGFKAGRRSWLKDAIHDFLHPARDPLWQPDLRGQSPNLGSGTSGTDVGLGTDHWIGPRRRVYD